MELTVVAGALLVVLLCLLVVWELRARAHPAMLAARHLPGKRIYPLIGNIFEGRKLTDGG